MTRCVPEIVTTVSCLSLYSRKVLLAHARGALSELLLAGEGDQTTVDLQYQGSCEEGRVVFPTAVTHWVENPSCSGLLQVSFDSLIALWDMGPCLGYDFPAHK